MTRVVLMIWLLLSCAALLTGCATPTEVTAPPAAAPDAAPPAVPAGLKATASEANVKLAWLANTVDADLRGYKVYRLAFESAWLLTDDPIQTPRFVDVSPLNGPVSYAVSAVDTRGNESAWVRIDTNIPVPAPVVMNP